MSGGVLIGDDDNSTIGAVGASGHKSEDDEAIILAGTEMVKLKADPRLRSIVL